MPAVKHVQSIEQLCHRRGAKARHEVEQLRREVEAAAGVRRQRPVDAAAAELLEFEQRLALEAGVREEDLLAARRERQRTAGCVAALGERVDLGALRVRQPQAFAELVEGFADRIVARLGESLDPGGGGGLDAQQQRVSAGNHQADEALGRRLRRLAAQPQERREEMRLHVMHTVELAAQTVGEALAQRETDEQRADETGAARRGDGVDLGEAHSGARERGLEDRGPVPQVLAGRDLGHDSAVRQVRELARHHRGEHAAVAVDDRAGGVVARGLDAQDQRRSALHGPRLTQCPPPGRGRQD